MGTRFGAGRSRRPTRGGGRPQRRPNRSDGPIRSTLPVPKKRDATTIELAQTVTVKELSDALGVAGGMVIKELIQRGFMVTMNQSIDLATATDVAAVFNVLVKQKEIDASEG